MYTREQVGSKLDHSCTKPMKRTLDGPDLLHDGTLVHSSCKAMASSLLQVNQF